MQEKMRRKILICFLAVLMLFSALQIRPSAKEKNSDTTVPEDACNGVVRILAIDSDGSAGTGSGFGVGVVGERTDIWVTNWHVVTLETDHVADKVYIITSNDAVVFDNSGRLLYDEEKLIECEVLYTTTGYPDVAILQAASKPKGRVALPLMHAEDAHRGETVYTLGYPGTADIANGKSYLYGDVDNVDIAAGVISKFFPFEIGGNTMAIQHNAHINHGNSGGPLITEDGAVIGINTYGYSDMEYSVSIYVDYAMEALDDLGIDYDIYGEEAAGGGTKLVFVSLAVAAVVVILAAVAVGIGRKKKVAVQPAAAGGFQAHPVSAQPISTQPTYAQSGQSILCIQGVSGTFAGRRIQAVNGRICIGRNPVGNDLVYPSSSPGISGRHCEIFLHEGEIFLRDLGSSYGTFVQGRKLVANQPFRISDGEPFSLGSPKESFIVSKQFVG